MKFKKGEKVYVKPSLLEQVKCCNLTREIGQFQNRQFTISSKNDKTYNLKGLTKRIKESNLTKSNPYKNIRGFPKKRSNGYVLDDAVHEILSFLISNFKGNILCNTSIGKLNKDCIYINCRRQDSISNYFDTEVIDEIKLDISSDEFNESRDSICLPSFDDLTTPLWRSTDKTKKAIKIYCDFFTIGYYLVDLNTLWTSYLIGDVNSCNILRKAINQMKEHDLSKLGRKTSSSKLKNDPIELTIGADPEFELYDKKSRRYVTAEDLSYFCEIDDYHEAPIGVDGNGDPMELRPDYVSKGNVDQFINNIKGLFHELKDGLGDSYRVSARGDKYAIGGHFHIGVKNVTLNSIPGKLIYLLDYFLGLHFYEVMGKAREKEGYGALSECKLQWYGGVEYRTPPSVCFSNPEITKICTKIVYNISKKYFESCNFKLDAKTKKATNEELKKYAELTNEEIVYLHEFIKSTREKSKSECVMAAWTK